MCLRSLACLTAYRPAWRCRTHRRRDAVRFPYAHRGAYRPGGCWPSHGRLLHPACSGWSASPGGKCRASLSWLDYRIYPQQGDAPRCSLVRQCSCEHHAIRPDRPLTARRATVGVAVENGERGPCSGAIGHCPLLPRVPLVWGRRVGDTGRSHAVDVACTASIIAFGQGVWNRRYDGDSQGE